MENIDRRVAVAGRDIVELIVQALRRRRDELVRLFVSPGQLIIDVDPRSKTVKVTVKVRV